MEVHPTKNVSIGIDPYPLIYIVNNTEITNGIILVMHGIMMKHGNICNKQWDTLW
jgi:hypothetical protein